MRGGWNYPMSSKPTAIDLFSGAGGLSRGLRDAGFRIVGAVEMDALACETYRANHPRARIWERDILSVTATEILKATGLQPGELDLIAACPPCQGFSSLRTRNGLQRNRDKRNILIRQVLRFARVMRPKTLMMENVPALATSTHFSHFRRGLRALGYQVKWDVLDTADFGVPQRRKRLVLLASRFGMPSFGPTVSPVRTVRDAISHLGAPSPDGDPLHQPLPPRSARIEGLIREIPLDGGSRESLPKKYRLACHKNFDGFRDVYGRMAWDRPAPTITGGCINPSKGRFLHPSAHRVVTLREAALLQSFPAEYKFSLSGGRFKAALQIGNALPPRFIRTHARALKAVLKPSHAPRD
ncbi:MAG: DNA cytosine methyltransferase [Vicinamibacteria bacterium]